MTEETPGFDIALVHSLVDSILQDDRSITPEFHWSFGDVEVFMVLGEILKTYLPEDQILQVYDKLRAVLKTQPAFTSLQPFHQQIKSCHRCPGLESPATPLGNLTNPKVVFVTSTSAEAVNLLERIKDLKIKLTGLAFTFLMRCHSTKDAVHEDSTAFKNCSSYLYHELDKWAPRLVVPVGLSPTTALLSIKSMTEAYGNTYWIGKLVFKPIPNLIWASQTTDRELELNQTLTSLKEWL